MAAKKGASCLAAVVQLDDKRLLVLALVGCSQSWVDGSPWQLASQHTRFAPNPQAGPARQTGQPPGSMGAQCRWTTSMQLACQLRGKGLSHLGQQKGARAEVVVLWKHGSAKRGDGGHIMP